MSAHIRTYFSNFRNRHCGFVFRNFLNVILLLQFSYRVFYFFSNMMGYKYKICINTNTSVLSANFPIPENTLPENTVKEVFYCGIL